MNMTVADLLTHPFALAIMGYGGLVVVLAIALQPLRLRMVDLAESMLAEGHWNQDQREALNTLLDTCASFGNAFLFPVVIVSALTSDVLREEVEAPDWCKRLEEDERFQGLIWRYFVSLLAANPIVAVLSIALMLLHLFVAAISRVATLTVAFQQPVLRVSAASNVHARGAQAA
jgi:hypothetical protein